METPCGALAVDSAVRDTLLASGLYDTSSQREDEEEHSIEMQLPYIAMITAAYPEVTVLPIMIGSLSTATARQYAETLQPYFDDTESLFVISRYVSYNSICYIVYP
jgi:AmmeMemoRadiSam system protein B